MAKRLTYEIWVIVLLILAIIVSILTNEYYTPHSDDYTDQVIDDDTVPVNIVSKIFENRKCRNIFKESNFDFETLEFSNSGILKEHGFDCEVCEINKESIDLGKILYDTLNDTDCNSLIHVVKANDNHHIKPTELRMMYEFGGSLKEAKNIWYIFPNVDWEFRIDWVFKSFDDDTYYAPENNTIIEFTKHDKYSLNVCVPKEHEVSKRNVDDRYRYFIVVINF